MEVGRQWRRCARGNDVVVSGATRRVSHNSRPLAPPPPLPPQQAPRCSPRTPPSPPPQREHWHQLMHAYLSVPWLHPCRIRQRSEPPDTDDGPRSPSCASTVIAHSRQDKEGSEGGEESTGGSALLARQCDFRRHAEGVDELCKKMRAMDGCVFVESRLAGPVRPLALIGPVRNTHWLHKGAHHLISRLLPLPRLCRRGRWRGPCGCIAATPGSAPNGQHHCMGGHGSHCIV